MKVWTLEKAKNAFSEVVRRALDRQPQIVIRGGRPADAVVIVARDDYERLLGAPSLVTFMRESPLAQSLAAGAFGNVEARDPFARDRGLGRDIDLGDREPTSAKQTATGRGRKGKGGTSPRPRK